MAANNKPRRAKEAALAAIGLEWDYWARKHGKPLTGASGTDGFTFFRYLRKEHPDSIRTGQREDEQWQAVQAYLKRTGRVG